MQEFTNDEDEKLSKNSEKRVDQLRETIKLWGVFITKAPLGFMLATQVKTQIESWKAELATRESLLKRRNKK